MDLQRPQDTRAGLLSGTWVTTLLEGTEIPDLSVATALDLASNAPASNGAPSRHGGPFPYWRKSLDGSQVRRTRFDALRFGSSVSPPLTQGL